MKPAFFRTLWGSNAPIMQTAREATDAGFTGLEGPFPSDPDAQRKFVDALRSHGLEYIAEISTTGYAVPDPGSTVQDHLDAMERIIEHSLKAEPVFFSAMAGSDLWEFRESVEFLTKAHAIAGRYGVRVGFETHRSRSLFHPVITSKLLAEVPPIELTLDFSHWCNVCERLVLDELPDVLAHCAERALHIQPRVGHDQGAQVPDPRAPHYRPAVEAHLRWWRAVWKSQAARGFARSTMTPEFGPDGYDHRHPYTREPFADLWELNRHMAKLLREEFPA